MKSTFIPFDKGEKKILYLIFLFSWPHPPKNKNKNKNIKERKVKESKKIH